MKSFLNIIGAETHAVFCNVAGSAVSAVRSEVLKERIFVASINFTGAIKRRDEAGRIEKRQEVRDYRSRCCPRQNQQDHQRQPSAYSETHNAGHKFRLHWGSS